MGTGWHESNVQLHHTFLGTRCVRLAIQLAIDSKKRKKAFNSYPPALHIQKRRGKIFSESYPHMADWLQHFMDILGKSEKKNSCSFPELSSRSDRSQMRKLHSQF